MKERPILFSGEMVRAILEGRKTQTRRILKHQPQEGAERIAMNMWDDGVEVKNPYGQPGDRLWVRETWQKNLLPVGPQYCYRATDEEFWEGPWRPSIFMPRKASRITLEITDVRVERLQDITEEDALKEGCQSIQLEQPYLSTQGLHEPGVYGPPSDMFFLLWQSIHGPGSWDKNPWLWVIEFKKI